MIRSMIRLAKTRTLYMGTLIIAPVLGLVLGSATAMAAMEPIRTDGMPMPVAKRPIISASFIMTS